MSSVWPNRVSIGDFTADNNTDDDFRITARVKGWGTPPIRLDIQERAQGDGGWDSTPLYGPRLVTVEGTVVRQSHAAAQSVADALCSLSLRQLHQLVVDNDALGPRTSLARLEVGADPDWFSDTGFSYSLQLRAPDPLKYGPETFASTTLAAADAGLGRVWSRAWPRDWGVPPGVTPGAAVVPNAGTASYHPRLRIDGAVSNPVVTLVETGAWVRFSGSVPDGMYLDFDLARRRVLLASPTNPTAAVSQRHKVTFGGDWLSVPVGGGTVTWSADSYNENHRLSAFGYEGAWL